MKSFALAILATSAMAVSLNATPPAKKEFDSNGHNLKGGMGNLHWDDGQEVSYDKNGDMMHWVRKDPLIEKYGVKYCNIGPNFICQMNGKERLYPSKKMQELRDLWLQEKKDATQEGHKIKEAQKKQEAESKAAKALAHKKAVEEAAKKRAFHQAADKKVKASLHI